MRWVEKLMKRLCRHRTMVLECSIEEGQMKEPGKEIRTIRMGLGVTKCPACDRVFKVTPMGILSDPDRGIDRNDFKVQTVVVPEDVRAEVLAGKA